MNYILSPLPLFVLSFFACVANLSADDWPQILGPNRNGRANGETLLEKWPAGGPEKIWSRPCGTGFAGVAVSDDQVYLFHRMRDRDLLECLEAATGQLVWKQDFQAVYRGGFSSDTGPRCVPLVSGGHVYLYGAGGTLRKLARKDGNQVWSRNLFAELRADEGYFGAGSSPILVDGVLVVIVGGKKGGIVGINEKGETIWKTEPDTASYSSPVALTFQKKKCVACVSKYRLKIVGVASGEVLLDQAFGERGPTVNAAAPLVFENRLFVTAAYRIGARMISLENRETVWENDTSLSSQYTTSLFDRGYLYGCNGREDFGNGSLRSVRAADGRVMWEEKRSGICHLIQVGQRALVWNIEGVLKLVELNPERYVELASAEVFSQNSKSLPALSNGRLFVKANGDQQPGKLVCLKVGK